MALTAVSRPPPATPVGQAEAQPPWSRLAYLDNLKTVLIAGVILAHAAITYGALGDWTYVEQSQRSPLLTVFGLTLVTGWLFALGLFFLMAGLLTPASLAHKGSRRFVRDRLVRLGVPLAAFVLIVMPLLRYWVDRTTHSDNEKPLLQFWAIQEWPKNTGPLWFAAFLLAFSLIYAFVWRQWPRHAKPDSLISIRWLLGLGIAIAAGSAVLRVVWPFDPRQPLNLHVGLWVQYPLMFWFGTVSAERGWLTSLPHRLWRACGGLALVAVAAVAALVIASGKLEARAGPSWAAWPWPDLVMAGLEGVVAVSASLWLLEWFRRHGNSTGAVRRALARGAYAAYVLQAPALVGVALALRPLDASPEVKLLALGSLALLLSFGIAWLLVVRSRILARIL